MYSATIQPVTQIFHTPNSAAYMSSCRWLGSVVRWSGCQEVGVVPKSSGRRRFALLRCPPKGLQIMDDQVMSVVSSLWA